MDGKKAILGFAAAALLSTASPALAAESPMDVMNRLRDFARRGDVEGFKTFVHPSKGIKDDSERIKRKQITQDYMLSAEFLKTARRDKAAKCGDWKRAKVRCDVSLGRSGGHSYHFVRTKKGVFLLMARIFDG